MAEGIVSVVVGRLVDLLTEEPQLLYGVTDKIQQVVTELMRMKTFLPDADSRINEQRVGILVAQVRDLVYDAENVVETFLLEASSSERRKTQGGIRKVKGFVCVLHDHACHHKFNREIELIQTRIQNPVFWFRDNGIISTLEGQELSSSSSYETPPGKLKRFYSYSVVDPDIFVGFQGDVESLVGHLVNESDDCYPVIFIGGMGGLGKTTLATKIYNHSTIKNHFSGLAWVSISQKWQPKAVLQRILIGLVYEKKEEILGMEFGKLVENLLEIQQMKNCLIVLDDIWSIEAWASLQMAFPNANSRSKLLLTSRNVDIAYYVNPKCFIHKPEVLNAEQSWELLRLKALPKGDYLDTRSLKKMEDLGREMVRNCDGLPLAIVVLGGILVTKPTLTEWEKVYYDSLSSLKKGKGLGEDQQREVFGILAWSYNDLPSQLKLCFLYMGKFGEDEEIEAETLYQLWIAEGMVLSSDKSGEETMMEVAEAYMRELVHKSMVKAKFEDDVCSQRKFKSFLLHDLMRDLSLYIAKGEDLFKVFHLGKVNDFQSDSSLEVTASTTRQLVVFFDKEGNTSRKDNPYFYNKSNQRRARSVLFFANIGLPRILGLHVANFRLLRVFALEGDNLDIQSVSCGLFVTTLEKMLGTLVYLRYLSLRSSKLLTFPSIQKLELLQTLKLNTWPQKIKVPSWFSNNYLGKLGHLRHLYLPQHVTHSSGKKSKLRFNGLNKLETLENFHARWCEVKDLPQLISLRKLRVTLVGIYKDVEEIIKYLSSYPSLRCLALSISICQLRSRKGADTLRQLFWNHKYNLQELRLDGELAELAQIFGQQQQQLSNIHIDASLIMITSLTLSNSWLEEDPMPILEKIPKLRNLHLKDAFMGKEMMCSAAGFPKLTFLRLEDLPNLVKWRVEEGSMPVLSELMISACSELEELPEGFIFLYSLRKIKLWSMPLAFCDRLRVVNGEKGPDLYKVPHVSDIAFPNQLSVIMQILREHVTPATF